ncbi:MAG TPA: hypothetical protein VGM89_09840 [Puia sp.]|jgi:cytochrome P450
MRKFGGTYSAIFPGNLRLILTEDPGFINYVLRERHTNYRKSEMSSGRGGRLFGNGLVFSNGDYWLRQRRLIQPGFHTRRLQGLYGILLRWLKCAVSYGLSSAGSPFPQQGRHPN